jgi:pimeloyl-ACP methyl ester carboxylesterase
VYNRFRQLADPSQAFCDPRPLFGIANAQHEEARCALGVGDSTEPRDASIPEAPVVGFRIVVDIPYDAVPRLGLVARFNHAEHIAGVAAAPDEHRPAHLVADPHPDQPLAESVERRHLVDSLRGLAQRGGTWLVATAARKYERARALADTAVDLGVPMPLQLATAALEWQARQDSDGCTPATTPPPDHPARDQQPPRIVILVGGLGSATGHTAVLDVDTASLGYDHRNVLQFSYADGPNVAYTPADTLGDIAQQGRRLAARIADLQRRHPDSPVDVIAHSQGGLVARSAITTHHARPATVVTLGTPHQGTDLATAATEIAGTTAGEKAITAIGRGANAAGLTGIDPGATSVRQMGETSAFIRNLPESGWDPAQTFVTSVAARGDPVVPNRHSHVQEPPAHNVVVEANGTQGLGDHVHLPGSPEATAEIVRAIARQPPTCRSLTDALVDAATSWRQSTGEDLVGAALTVAALAADARAGRGP